MPYIPHSEADQQRMLSGIGLSSIEELFADVPASHRYPSLDLPPAASEMEILDELYAMALKNSTTGCFATFVGAGAYNHFVPSVVPYLTGRGEFATAYTPYQPEVSQGTLQSIFEYQSMVARLIGMDAVNASHYDGATAMAEAAIMAVNISRGKRTKVLVSPSVHPQYRDTLRTYLSGGQATVVGDDNLRTSLAELLENLDQDTACLIIQNPNFFGELMDVEGLADAVHAVGALLVVVANPVISLGMLKPPGEYGADIAVAEGQGLGVGLNFGGPYLGIFAAREKYVRKMPGRLVGETTDSQGRRGYVLTLHSSRTTYSPRKSDQQYLHQSGIGGPDRRYVSGIHGQEGVAGGRRTMLSQSSLCCCRDRQIARLPSRELRTFFNEFPVKCSKASVRYQRRVAWKRAFWVDTTCKRTIPTPKMRC